MTKGSLYYKIWMKEKGVMETNKSHTYRILRMKDSPWNKRQYVIFYDTSSDRRSMSEVQFDFFNLGFEKAD